MRATCGRRLLGDGRRRWLTGKNEQLRAARTRTEPVDVAQDRKQRPHTYAKVLRLDDLRLHRILKNVRSDFLHVQPGPAAAECLDYYQASGLHPLQQFRHGVMAKMSKKLLRLIDGARLRS